jgi:TolA-binding protein
MKKNIVFAMVLACILSCAGGPKGSAKAPAASQPASLRPAAQTPATVLQPVTESESPVVETPPQTPEEQPLAEELAEPEIDLPEVELGLVSPEENLDLAALPEPIPPDFPAPVATEVPAPEADTPLPLSPPAAPPSTPIPATPVPPPRPAPPPYLAPAEEESPPAIGREPVPVPAHPAPEPPAEHIPLPGASDETIVFSRTVRALVGQMLEVPFRGTGWVFLGEQGARRGIAYDSRRLESEGQNFVFRIEAAGTYVLKFYKQDFLRDFILNDYVQVIVGDPPESAGAGWFKMPLDQNRVIAEPRWPGSLEEARASRQSGMRGGAPPLAPAPAASSKASPPPSSEAAGSSATPPSGGMPPATPPPEGNTAGSAARPAVSAAATATQTPSVPVQAPVQPPASPAAVSPLGDEGVVPVQSPALSGGTAAALPPPSNPSAALPQLPPDTPPEDFLQKAREELQAGRPAAAIALLDQFRQQYPAGSDEALWLFGQYYEAAGPSRNVLTALGYYRRLVQDYPQSPRYNDARRRIAYLERYYINIQ